MVCDEVKRFVYFFLDDTLGSARRNQLQVHLGLCPACGERVLIQRRLREFVRRRLTGQSAPSHLRERLVEACRSKARTS